MKILVICSECYPVGDSPLARTVGSIVSAYRRLGAEVLGFSPFFSELTNKKDYKQGNQNRKFIEKLENREYSVLESSSNENDLFIHYDHYFGRAGVYGNPGEKPYYDNNLRFSFLASAALNYCEKMQFKPDGIHVHEWGGIAGALTKTVYKDYFANIPVLLTAHNIRYDYLSNPEDIPKIGLPPEGFDIDGYEFWGKVSMLKASMLYSDKVVFTSAAYMSYLLSTDLQGGMRGFLESQRNKLSSIQSGIDYAVWKLPKERDSYKKQCKDSLREKLGMDVDSSMVIYSHIDFNSEDSAQIISTILANLLNLDLQLIIGISENNANYPYFTTIQEKHKNKIALLPLTENEETIYQRIVASDMFFSINAGEPSLSRFIKAFAAGSIPFSNKRAQECFVFTVPFKAKENENSTNANAFISESSSPDMVLELIRTAESIFRENKSLWARLVDNAVSVKVSWDCTAEKYLLLLGNKSN
jgi:starch synthase